MSHIKGLLLFGTYRLIVSLDLMRRRDHDANRLCPIEHHRSGGWFPGSDQVAQSAGCEKVFAEQVSSTAQREQLEAALEYAREGDTLVVTKLDRLARSVSHLVAIGERLELKGVALKVLDQAIDTSTCTGRLIPNRFAISVGPARRLRRRRPKGGQLSLRGLSKELAARGFLNELGKPSAAKSVASMLR